jgi:ribulose 1,5-bisphosphate synthetase/thiazole synthase
MKNRLNIDKDKFRLMIERMEVKHTFNQVNESIKHLITEGIGDDIVRYSKNLAKNLGADENLVTRIETAVSSMSKAIEDYAAAITSLTAGGSFENLKNLLNAKSLRITMDNFSTTFTSTLKKYFNEVGANFDEVAAKNYVSGLSNEMPNNFLTNLNEAQIRDLININYLMSQLTKTDFALDKLNRINEMWNKLNKPEDFRNLILGFVGEDGVKSISELEDSFKQLDDLKNGTTPKELELYDIWLRVKEQVGLGKWDGTDFKTLFKNSFASDPKYKLLEKSFLDKLKFWNSKKINVSLEKIKNKNLSWDNTIVFYNKNSDPETIFIVELKDAKSLENYKKILKDGDIDFEVAGTKENALTAVEQLARYDLRVRRIKLSLYVSLGAVAVGFLLCPLFVDDLTPEEIALREKGGGDNAIKEKGYGTKLLQCVGSVIQKTINLGEDIGQTIFKEDILGPMQEFNGYIITEVEKICPKEESGDNKCCMDCNNDEKLKSIIAKPELLAKYESAVRNIDPEFLKQKVTGMGVTDSETIIQEILNEAKNNENVSKYLTNDGKPMSFVEILRLECNKKALPCVEERVKTLWDEIIDIMETRNCDSLQNEINIKVQEMKTYGDAGYLTVDVSDKNKEIPKVYIDIMQRSDIFGSVTTVDEFFITLSNWINKVAIEAQCNTGNDGGVETVDVENIVDDFTKWCDANGKDNKKTKSLMEFLWSEGVAQLDCGSGDNSIDYMFKPNPQTKINSKYQVFSIFDEYFKPVFPSIDRMDEDWDDAFTYWYDKQKSLCGF